MTDLHTQVAAAIRQAALCSSSEADTAAIVAEGVFREGAVERCKRMHYERYGAECSDWDAEGFIDAILGPPEVMTARPYRCACGLAPRCGCRLTDPPSYWGVDGERHFYDEPEPRVADAQKEDQS